MLLQKESHSTTSDIEEIFPHHPQPLLPEKASEILHSHMITGFEQAVELGMTPIEALSTVLIWVSCEMGRVKAGHARVEARP